MLTRYASFVLTKNAIGRSDIFLLHDAHKFLVLASLLKALAVTVKLQIESKPCGPKPFATLTAVSEMCSFSTLPRNHIAILPALHGLIANLQSFCEGRWSAVIFNKSVKSRSQCRSCFFFMNIEAAALSRLFV